MTEQQPKVTPEQASKEFAFSLYTRFKNLGLTHQKAQDAAHTCILALTDQYLKLSKGTARDNPDARKKAMENFQRLAKDLNDYFAGRKYVEVPIEEIAALKGCKKDQVLIIY